MSSWLSHQHLNPYIQKVTQKLFSIFLFSLVSFRRPLFSPRPWRCRKKREHPTAVLQLFVNPETTTYIISQPINNIKIRCLLHDFFLDMYFIHYITWNTSHFCSSQRNFFLVRKARKISISLMFAIHVLKNINFLR